MRALPVTLAAILLLAGCLGSGGGSGRSVGSSSSPGGPCQGPRTSDKAAASPGLYASASANQMDGGNRTLRWDLVIEGVCQGAGATVTVQASTAPSPQDCPPVAYRASVTTGVTESEVALTGNGDLQGERAFQPQRTDLGSGPASFVASFAATMATKGFEPHDQECLEASLHSFALHAAYRSA